MQRKLFVLAMLFSLLCVTSVSALGLGAQLDGNVDNMGGGAGASVTFKLKEYPLIFAANISGSAGSGIGFGLTGDYWFFNKPISSEVPFSWFFGVGGYAGFWGGSGFNCALGARLPIGINSFFSKKTIEPYLQVSPQLGVVLGTHWYFPAWSVPASLGVRFWF